MIKIFRVLLAVFLAGFSSFVHAAYQKPNLSNIGQLSGSFNIASNYLFRGLSLSNNNPAVQGGLTYKFTKPGIYFNAWGSNVDLRDPQGRQATVELDTAVGVANSITEDFSYDVNLVRYNYPKANGLAYNEFIAIGTYKFLRGTLGYSPNVNNTHRTGIYYEGSVIFDIPSKYVYFDGVSAQGAVGYYSLPKYAGNNSYKNYLIAINKTISIYKLTLQWTGTDGRAKQAPLDRNQITAIVTASF